MVANSKTAATLQLNVVIPLAKYLLGSLYSYTIISVETKNEYLMTVNKMALATKKRTK